MGTWAHFACDCAMLERRRVHTAVCVCGIRTLLCAVFACCTADASSDSLPLILKYGFIDTLTISIPWKAIMSAPLQITVHKTQRTPRIHSAHSCSASRSASPDMCEGYSCSCPTHMNSCTLSDRWSLHRRSPCSTCLRPSSIHIQRCPNNCYGSIQHLHITVRETASS